MAVASAVLQYAEPVVSNATLSPLMVPALSAIVGGVMSYAVLRTTVQKMEADVRDMRGDMSEMYALLRDALTKIAHVEGRLDRSS